LLALHQKKKSPWYQGHSVWETEFFTYGRRTNYPTACIRYYVFMAMMWEAVVKGEDGFEKPSILVLLLKMYVPLLEEWSLSFTLTPRGPVK
jgi:hypothetical protein